KGGFSRPSSFTLCGVSSRPFLPQDKESFFEIHRTQKKRLSFSRSLAYSICWGGFSFTKACFTIVIHPSQFHKHLNLFISRNIRCTCVLLFVNPKHYIVD